MERALKGFTRSTPSPGPRGAVRVARGRAAQLLTNTGEWKFHLGEEKPQLSREYLTKRMFQGLLGRGDNRSR